MRGLLPQKRNTAWKIARYPRTIKGKLRAPIEWCWGGEGVAAWKRYCRTIKLQQRAPIEWCWGGGWRFKERNWMKDCKISNENYKRETKSTNWVAHCYAIFLCSWDESLVGQLTTNWVMLRWGKGLLPLAICTLALVRSQDFIICHPPSCLQSIN